MEFPKFSLFHSAARSLSGQLSLRVNVPQWKVAVRQTHAAFVFGEQVLQGWLDPLAIRALKIRKLHNNNPGLGIPPEPGRVVSDLDFRLLQEYRDTGLLPKLLIVILASFLDFGLLQQLLKLRPELVERLPQLLLLHNI